jgi:DNA-binding beta-propeller fold protein YncE
MSKHIIAALILFVLSLTITEYAQSNTILFAKITNPNGVAVDQAGNVYVESLSILGDGGLFKFAPNGALMARNKQLIGKFRLAPDPLHGVIWAQEISGNLYYIDPNTLQAYLFMDLRTWAFNHNQEPVLNMLTGKTVPLIMVSPNFGDIAMRQVGDQLDLFITGLTYSGGGMPFVLRLRFKSQTLQSVKIVAASIPKAMVIPPPLSNYPYGIAVNSSGTVLTAMPDQLNEALLRTPLFLATFRADYPEIVGSKPTFVKNYYPKKQAFAIGMTASAKNGGFYVATVANGFGCGAGPAILYFPPTLNGVTCIANLSSWGLGDIQPADIALKPDERFLYVTMTQRGWVLRLQIAK